MRLGATAQAVGGIWGAGTHANQGTFIMANYTRRTVVRGAAWTVPVIAVAAPIPAFSSSADPITGIISGGKCPGNSVPAARDSVIITFRALSAADAQAVAAGTITRLTVNGVDQDVLKVKAEGSLVYVVSTDRGNSSQSSGSVTIEYSINGQDFVGTFAYLVSPPTKQLCDRVTSS